MRLISVNAGQPREARWRGRIVRSAIWKDPLPGRVRVTKLHLEGDRQADPSLHGGGDKAITLGELAWGSFGENLTTEGLLEDEVRIGDALRIGSRAAAAGSTARCAWRAT